VESYGERSLNVISGIWWHPTFPYKSSLSGETCQQIADGFEKETGKQWTSPLAHYIVFEAVANALQRAKDLDDKESIIQAVSTIKVDTIEGPMDFTAPVQPGTAHPFVNVVTTPLCYGQWVKGTKWPWDIVIISNANGVPDVQVQAKIQPLPV
jgi:branched-chain amino acid transport system substrate-binding protein